MKLKALLQEGFLVFGRECAAYKAQCMAQPVVYLPGRDLP